MKQLIQNRWASLTVRCVVFGPFVVWIVLFTAGWASTRPERGPSIEGKSLYAWDDDLSDGSILDSANSPERIHATTVLRRHSREIMPTLLDWARRKEALSAEVYFCTLAPFIGKRSPYAFGEAAHSYRGAAARILGALGPIDPQVLPTLHEIRDSKDNFDYEREVAQRSLERIADAASSHQ